MSAPRTDRDRALELSLIIIAVALTCLLYRVSGHKMVVLNLFYLPVVLAAFFLGRYRAGVFALFCVVAASAVTVLDLHGFAAYTSPVAIGLAVTIWGAVMGLNALLVGTLSDERTQKLQELHDAYVGVVEVLSRYLSSADPKLKDRSQRISELSQKVAAQMRLSERETDNIRVAALLQDLSNVEITARVIKKAVGDLGSDPLRSGDQHTFHGSDFVQSLGTVLTGALPLLFENRDSLASELGHEVAPTGGDVPFGARILHTVRSYDALLHGGSPARVFTPSEALEELRFDVEVDHHPAVLHALEQVVLDTTRTTPREPAERKPEPALVEA